MSAAHQTPGGAVLYTVNGPRGSYFAIHDPAVGRVWTDRTGHAARTRASELGLFLVAEESVTHEELMRRTGRDADASRKDTNPDASAPFAAQPAAETPADPPPRPHLLFDDTGESVVVRRVGPEGLLPAHPLEPHYSDLSDDAAPRYRFTTLTPPEEDWIAPDR